MLARHFRTIIPFPMLHPKLRSLVSHAFLLTLACSPDVHFAGIKGPTIELSAATPVAEYAVRLCMDGPEIDGINDQRARFYANIRMSADSRQPSAYGKILVDGVPKAYFDPIPGGDPLRREVKLDATGPWNDQAGPRCTEPRMVRFECEDPLEFTQLTIEWNAEFTVPEPNTLCRSRLMEQTEMSIRIEPVPPS